MSTEVSEKQYDELLKEGYVTLLKVIPNLEQLLKDTTETIHYENEEFKLLCEIERYTDFPELKFTISTDHGIQPAIEFEIEVHTDRREIQVCQRKWNDYARVEYSCEQEFNCSNPNQFAIYFFMVCSFINWLEYLADEKVFLSSPV